MDYATVLSAIQEWSVEDRRRLVIDLCETLGIESAELTDADRNVLDERLTAYEASGRAGSSWEEVKARVWAKP